MRTLGKFRYVRIAGLALGAVVVAVAAVLVTASAAGISLSMRPANPSQPATASTAAPEQSNATSTVCSNFMKHFAVRIGKSQAEINTAFQQAIADTLKDQVNGKQLTQAQSDQMKQKLATLTPCTLPSKLAPQKSKPKATIGAYMTAYENAAAAALGISPNQLKTDLKGGQSLSQIAAARHVSEADFRTKLIANMQPTLDMAVANKHLTAAQEQTIINQLKNGQLPLWNRPAHPKTTAPAANPTPANA